MQEVRQHKKRVPKHMDEPNIFSGMVFLADCGKPLVLHRASTMKRTEYNFKCYTYGKKGKTVCTPHHIREFELKAVVLEEVRRVTHFARMKEKQFAAYNITRKVSVLFLYLDRFSQHIWLPNGTLFSKKLYLGRNNG